MTKLINGIFMSAQIKNSNFTKIFPLIITLGSMLLYIPVNRLISGGRTFESPLDKFIPLVPVFLIPYLFGIVFWLATIFYINIKKKGELVSRFNLKITLASILSVLIYILFPTFVNRPQITGTDIFSNILNWVYANDRVYNATPSGHVFYTILCLLTMWKVSPKYRLLWILISILIIASTVFTKQHNIFDVFWGTAFALIIYFIGKAISTHTRRS